MIAEVMNHHSSQGGSDAPPAESVPELMGSTYVVNNTEEESKRMDYTVGSSSSSSRPPSILKEPLFDRSAEISQLQHAYKHLIVCRNISAISLHHHHHHKNNFCLVSGEAGSGKTTVATTLKETVDKDGGYFVSGSFVDAMNMEPYHAFATALSDFVTQVVARDKVSEIKDAIHHYGGGADNNHVQQDETTTEMEMLINVFPALEEIMGSQEQSDVASSNNSALPLSISQDAGMRFAHTFQLFLSAIATPTRPLVIFLDDLHHADECSLALLAKLVSDVNSSDHVLFLCTCSSDLDKSNPVCETLRTIEDAHVKITDIAISNLCIDRISAMLSKLLNAPKAKSESLASGILMRTSGNALFVVEYVRKFQAQGLLYYDATQNQWTWDEEDIRRAMNCSCMFSLMNSQMGNVPQQLKELLKVASCLGMKLQETVLSRAMSAPHVSAYMEMALERHFVLLVNKKEADDGTYSFTNGHVRETFYRLIEEESRPEFHLAIGRRLLRNFSSEELEKHVFLVLNQMRRGSHLVTSRNEKHTMASLCLLAGKKFVKASSFRPASITFAFGISLLCRNSWKDEYDLTLDLHSSSAEVNYVMSDFDRKDDIIQQVLGNAREFRDQLRAWYVRVLTLGAQDRAADAVKDGIFVLGELGERFPKKPRLGLALWLEFKSVHRKLRGMTDERILRLPDMTDPDKLAAMQMLNLLFLNAYMSQTNLYPFMALRMVELSLEHGLCAISSFGFAMFGMMAIGITNDISEGFRYGSLALRLIDKYQAKQWIPRVYVISHGCLAPWKLPMSRSLGPLLQASRIGQESGDVEFALLAANMYCFNSLDAGRPLKDLEGDVAEFRRLIEIQKHDLALTLIAPLSDLVRSLTGSMDYREVLQKRSSRNDDNAPTGGDFCIAIEYYFRAVVAYLYNDLEAAEPLTLECYSKFKGLPLASYEVCQIESFISVVSISLVRSKRYKLAGRRTHLRIVRRTMRRLRPWVKENPGACYGKLFLLEAEMAAHKDNVKKAQGKYTCALAMTNAEHLLLEHAIQGERAGRFMYEHGEAELSKDFYRDVHETYVNWGALARADFLREEVERLFPGEKVL